ncbi:MAG TPA: hypothetical protein VLT82_08405 [Myxococcaceae bacterium]|nr:hypothetical protein [Myxococcaceae bacterium]
MRTLVTCAVASALVLLTGCPAEAPASCQTLATVPTPVASDGYVLRFVRSTPASPGCETATPDEMSDIWVFNTVANGVVLAHSVRMPFSEGAPTPPGVVGTGTFAGPEVDADGLCEVPSLTTMSDSTTGTLFSYQARDLVFLGSPAYQGAEFKGTLTVSIGTCVADYDVQALSPAVPCQTDQDCDPLRTPFSSGIARGFDQGCTFAPWTATVMEYLATQYPGNSGVCFLRQPFPSLNPGADQSR